MLKKSRISFLLLISIFTVIFSDSCKLKNSEKSVEINEYTFLAGGTELNKINFVEMRKDECIGDSLIIIFNKNYKVLQQIKCERISSFSPYFITDKYFVIGIFRDENNGGRRLILYDNKKNEVRNVPIKYHSVGNLFIYNDLLFFSSEMANPHLNVFNLKTNELTAFDEYYCPMATYGVVDGQVYACYEKDFYLYKNSAFYKVEGTVSSCISKNYTVDASEINKSILKRLKFKK